MAIWSPLRQSQPAPPKTARVPASLLTPSRPGQLLRAATIDWAVIAAAAAAMARGPRLLYPALALVVAGRLNALVLALAAATALWPRALLTVYFVPLAMALAFNGYRFLLEHTHRPAAGRSPDSQLETTRNTFCGSLGRLLLAPHNVGYHLVHHLHPGAS